MSAIDRLRQAHAEQPDPKHERRRLSIARTWKRDEHMEALLKLPEDKRARILGQSPMLRLSYGSYVESKKVYEELKGQL